MAEASYELKCGRKLKQNSDSSCWLSSFQLTLETPPPHTHTPSSSKLANVSLSISLSLVPPRLFLSASECDTLVTLDGPRQTGERWDESQMWWKLIEPTANSFTDRSPDYWDGPLSSVLPAVGHATKMIKQKFVGILKVAWDSLLSGRNFLMRRILKKTWRHGCLMVSTGPEDLGKNRLYMYCTEWT